MKLSLLLKNQVIGYALTRYLVSGISFITSMIVAIKLGSYLLGIWGVFLLLRRYLQLINLGIPDSSTILLIQNKNSPEEKLKIESNAIIILGLISVLIIASGLYAYFIGIDYVNKYNLRFEYLLLCAIAVFTLYDDLFCKIYRVEGRISEITFYQSIIQLLSFILVFLFTGQNLIYALISAYLIGTIISFFIFLIRGQIHYSFKINFKVIKALMKKGIFLFTYNLLFYLIFISTRTFVSYYYDVSEFGYFTFANTLSNAIILLIDAIASLLIPKLIDRYHTNNILIINDTINKLRINYMYASYFLMFVLLIAFTGLLFLLRDYYNTYNIVVFMAITVVIQTHSFAYTVYMMANNKEKLIALCSSLALGLNIILNLLSIILLQVGYQYVIIGTSISYLCFTFACVYYSRKNMGISYGIISVIRECLPLNLTIPLIILLISGIYGWRWLLLLSTAIFFILNHKILYQLTKTLRSIINNPHIINIK